MIPIARPCMGEAEAGAARRVILSGWVSQGPEVAAFEKEFAAYVGAEHAVAVSNCTTALHLALIGLGIGPGDEVITASHSFIATANAIRYTGARPIFVDIDERTFNLDPALVERSASPRTRALLVPHQIGMPADLGQLLPLAARLGLRVVEDAACAVGSEIATDGSFQRIGRPHGDIACFSFHPRKVMTTGDGGMITLRDGALADQLRRLRQHGMSASASARHGAAQVEFESYPELGYNYRMTDIQAAVGREQLRRMPDMVAERRALAARYAKLLAKLPGVVAPFEPAWARSNWQSYAVYLPARCDQRAVMQSMLDNGVSTRRAVMCSHREGAYPVGTFGLPPGGLPRSEAAQDRAIVLPFFQGLTAQEQERVVATLAAACEKTAP